MNDTQRILLATMLYTVVLLCVMGVLAAVVISEIDGINLDPTTIGGTSVPAIHCEEDEVISWIGIDALGCVHYEEVR